MGKRGEIQQEIPVLTFPPLVPHLCCNADQKVLHASSLLTAQLTVMSQLSAELLGSKESQGKSPNKSSEIQEMLQDPFMKCEQCAHANQTWKNLTSPSKVFLCHLFKIIKGTFLVLSK